MSCRGENFPAASCCSFRITDADGHTTEFSAPSAMKNVLQLLDGLSGKRSKELDERWVPSPIRHNRVPRLGIPASSLCPGTEFTGKPRVGNTHSGVVSNFWTKSTYIRLHDDVLASLGFSSQIMPA